MGQSTSDLIGRLRQIARHVYPVNASQLSMERFGTYRMANYVLLGVVLYHTELPIKRDTVEALLRSDEEKEALQIGFGLLPDAE